MSIARMHHYVPQCYLKGFTRGKDRASQLFAVDVVEQRTFWTSPKNVCVVRDFNRVEVPGQPHDILERQLAKFDGELGAALQTISEMRSLDAERAKLVLLNFASVVAVRNPGFRARMEDFQRELMDMMADATFATKERYERLRARIQREEPGKPLPDAPYERVRDSVRNRDYTIEFPHGYHTETEFHGQDAVLGTMLARNWALLRAPPGSEFVTSDRPVCLWPNKVTRMPVGFGLRSTTVVLPVTSSLLAMGTFDGAEGAVDATRDDLATLNLSVAARCDRLVFAKSAEFETSDSDGRVTVGPDLIHRVIARERRPRNESGVRAATREKTATTSSSKDGAEPD